MQSGCVGGRRPSAPGSWCAPVRPAALERPPAPAQPPPWAPQLPPWGAPQLPPWVAPQLPPWVAPQLPPWLEKSQEAAPLQRGHRAPQLPPWAAQPPSNSTTLRCEAELLFHRQSGLLREQMLRKRRMGIPTPTSTEKLPLPAFLPPSPCQFTHGLCFSVNVSSIVLPATPPGHLAFCAFLCAVRLPTEARRVRSASVTRPLYRERSSEGYFSHELAPVVLPHTSGKPAVPPHTSSRRWFLITPVRAGGSLSHQLAPAVSPHTGSAGRLITPARARWFQKNVWHARTPAVAGGSWTR